MTQSRPYVGRFAPSPSGPLHLGSLVAALGSYLDARAQGGRWLLRIEDLDPPRIVPGATLAILRTLQAYGFAWDGEIVFQASRVDAYQAVVEQLLREDLLYGCICSRKGIAEAAREGLDGPVYPGTCRDRPPLDGTALRLRTEQAQCAFVDRLQGEYRCGFAEDLGDFVVKRADGVFTYQLAVVVDDAAVGITDVVRGADLIASTPRQMFLQQVLGLPTPRYLHLPVVLDSNGDKLSKQTLATPLNDDQPLVALRQAARFLGLGEIPGDSLDDFWSHAIAAWNVANLSMQSGLAPDS